MVEKPFDEFAARQAAHIGGTAPAGKRALSTFAEETVPLVTSTSSPR